jgi:two-component system, NarL family, response regulator NreC
MDNTRIRILVADDHNLFRSGIINLMNDEKDIFVIGEAGSGEELIKKYSQLKPDIVLADISMPDMNGIEALKKIKEEDKSAKFLFLSMHEGDEYIYYCYNAGGMGLISKKVLKGELLFAIRTVSENKKYFGINITEEKLNEILERYDKKNLYPEIINDYLTPREKQILSLISEGFTSNEIAEKLYLSKRTVDTHRTHLMQKLNLKSFPELIKYAINFSFAEKSE